VSPSDTAASGGPHPAVRSAITYSTRTRPLPSCAAPSTTTTRTGCRGAGSAPGARRAGVRRTRGGGGLLVHLGRKPLRSPAGPVTDIAPAALQQLPERFAPPSGRPTYGRWHTRASTPHAQGLREALCALGNGYFVTRGALPEAKADDVNYPGTYVAGLYNRLTSKIAARQVENVFGGSSASPRPAARLWPGTTSVTFLHLLRRLN
jgi:hypothetical protein